MVDVRPVHQITSLIQTDGIVFQRIQSKNPSQKLNQSLKNQKNQSLRNQLLHHHLLQKNQSLSLWMIDAQQVKFGMIISKYVK